MIRVRIPYHLRVLANTEGEIELRVADPVTAESILEALEDRYPMLRGSIRDRATGKRRSLVRFYACEQDLSQEPLDTPLPAAIASGAEPFLIIGALAGG